ncbi:MAG: anaerobic ribonucleoside-triphosphate reductase activating protein [bacterium]|nr:anaerobic ribonucleoside-triphosphate reductase activating protein [bacterium]
MIIGGFQKLSLVDFPGKVASIVFTKGCVFRCAYCHNPELVLIKDHTGIDEEEVWGYLKRRKSFLDGVCVTGGEPTLHKDLPHFLERIKGLGLSVKLDTNGVTPAMLRALVEKKLVDYFAMDLKHRWSRYGEVAAVSPGKEYLLDRCRESFEVIRDSGIPYEWRTTVFPGVHAEDDFFEMAGYMKPGEKYYLQEISYKKNLAPLDRSKSLDVPRLAKLLSAYYPKVDIAVR